MRNLLVSAAIFMMFGATGAPAQDASGRKDNVPPDGFVALFNGQDLKGWLERGKEPTHWSVKDGLLAYDGKGADLFHTQPFKNFVLLADWKVEKKGNSGVYLRSGNPQAEINDADDPKGKIWNGTSGGLYPDRPPTKRAARPTGEWNHFEITVKGNKISVKLNGETTVDEFEKNWGSKTSGTIGFQNHGTPVWYKNIFIKNLGE